LAIFPTAVDVDGRALEERGGSGDVPARIYRFFDTYSIEIPQVLFNVNLGALEMVGNSVHQGVPASS
jgi:hypothetical protein